MLPANGPLANKTPMYGEGIPLIMSTIGPTLFAKNQTGACYEEKLKDEREVKTKPTLQAKRQINGILEPRRKFQRRDTSSETADGGVALQVRNKLPKSILPDPVIDQFTHLLGVGWALIGDDVGVQAAARGWARYIENHYPVSMVRLVLKSKGLDAYLAETQNGYFLFSDDLSEGQLVGSSWEICLTNLQHTPVTFEGVQTLKAIRTPSAEIISPQIMVLSASPAGPVDVQVVSRSNEDICMLSA